MKVRQWFHFIQLWLHFCSFIRVATWGKLKGIFSDSFGTSASNDIESIGVAIYFYSDLLGSLRNLTDLIKVILLLTSRH